MMRLNTSARSLRRLTAFRPFAVLIALLGFGWGCGDGPTGPPPAVATVSITPVGTVELVPGGAEMVQVIPKDASGSVLTARTVTWSSSDSSKVTVAGGLITGVAVGTAVITASVEGRTASVDAVVKEGAVVSSAGGAFTLNGGAVVLTFPAGALASTRNLTVVPAAAPPANARLLPGTAFDFGPVAATFASPVTITIKYDPSKIAAGSPEAGLQLYEVIGGLWRVVAGSTVNLTTKTVSGNVTRFGTFAVMMQPKVESIAFTGDVSNVVVGTTRQLAVILRDDQGDVLSRPVTWATSNSAILAVNASSGLATPGVPGTVIVTATSEGKSVTASITVVAGPPARLIANTGDGQGVAAGAAVPVPPSVKVTDAAGNPVAGVAVTFAVASGGGTITGASATTNASGVATVGSWVLGTTAGPNLLSASSAAVPGVVVTFTAAAGAGPAAIIVANAGNNQSATAGGLVATPPSVKVTDANNNPVANVAVTFTPGPGSGSVTGGVALSNNLGIATVGGWRLGTTPGAQTLIASASGLTGSPITFSATAVAPIPATMTPFAGNNQTARPGRPIATLPSVRITDAAGIPVPGYVVTFVVVTGGGTITGAEATTNADGIATVGSWTLGPTIGDNQLTATAGTLGGSPFTFRATAVALPAAAIAINAGDNQTALANAAVPIAPSVKVTDAEGVGVSGVSVVFSIRSGAGTITGANAVTNASGIATVGSWTLGIGGNSLFATVEGLAGSPVVFVALGQAEVQLVTFGDSNTDLGYQGTDPAPRVASYVSNANPAIRLGPGAPNSPLQLAGKVESRWRANRSKTIKVVNHGISSTGTGTGRSFLGSPNALTAVDGVTRFDGEVLGAAYPWNGNEPFNDFFPDGPVRRVQAFVPRTSDYAYISMGTNDIGPGGLSATEIRNNIEIMIDKWTASGLPANRLMVATVPPRNAGASGQIPQLNNLIRTLAQAKGVRLIDVATLTSNDNGLTWKSPTLHVTNDELHYAESVRDAIADQIVSIMFQGTP